MRLQQLHLILALAQAGSLRAAALTLNVTQPALTKSLHQLEDEFATPLVLRTPKGVRLTPAGELVRARAAAVLREIERAREDVAWQMRHAHARVSVGVSPAAALLLAPGALARLRARWPQVRAAMVDALYPRALAMVRDGEIDLAVGPLPPEGAGPDLRVQSLFDGRTSLVVRSGSPHAQATELVDLVDAPWVLAGPVGGPGDPRRMDFRGRELPPTAITLECESFSTLLAVLPSMDAVALVPAGFYEHHGPRLGLVRLPITEGLPRVTLHAVWRADTPLTAPAGTLLDALEQEARLLRRPAAADSTSTSISPSTSASRATQAARQTSRPAARQAAKPEAKQEAKQAGKQTDGSRRTRGA
jgi:DNA-binding transcriptional LysR family regulator